LAIGLWRQRAQPGATSATQSVAASQTKRAVSRVSVKETSGRRDRVALVDPVDQPPDHAELVPRVVEHKPRQRQVVALALQWPSLNHASLLDQHGELGLKPLDVLILQLALQAYHQIIPYVAGGMVVAVEADDVVGRGLGSFGHVIEVSVFRADQVPRKQALAGPDLPLLPIVPALALEHDHR